jgi:hypothetical protein
MFSAESNAENGFCTRNCRLAIVSSPVGNGSGLKLKAGLPRIFSPPNTNGPRSTQRREKQRRQSITITYPSGIPISLSIAVHLFASSTIHGDMSSVWVQIYYKGEAKPVGEADPIKIEPIPKNVNDLKIAVRAAKPTKLNHVDAGDLRVYASGTDVPVEDGPKGLAALAANVSGSDAARGASYDRPLIVIAPKPEQQYGKLRCCFRIHLYCSVFLFLYSNVASSTKIYVCSGIQKLFESAEDLP